MDLTCAVVQQRGVGFRPSSLVLVALHHQRAVEHQRSIRLRHCWGEHCFLDDLGRFGNERMDPAIEVGGYDRQSDQTQTKVAAIQRKRDCGQRIRQTRCFLIQRRDRIAAAAAGAAVVVENEHLCRFQNRSRFSSSFVLVAPKGVGMDSWYDVRPTNHYMAPWAKAREWSRMGHSSVLFATRRGKKKRTDLRDPFCFILSLISITNAFIGI